MRSQDLREYEERERDFILRESRAVVERGELLTAAELYPDVNLSHNLGFGRGPVPLSLLLLLHEKLALYVPPTSETELHQRWQLSPDTVFDLCECRLIQPLIGHPADYKSKHLERILKLTPPPPSVWARGLALLDALGMGDKLEEAKRELPLDRIARLSWVRSRWRRHFPEASEDQLTTRIKTEVATLYADLWLFGLGPLALNLRQLGGPSKMVQTLLRINEIKTYPILFGLGGTAHYDLNSLLAEPSIFDSVKQTRRNTLLIPRDLDILLKGIGVPLKTLSTENIIEFHASGLGVHLRKVVSDFNRQSRLLAQQRGSTENVLSAAMRLQDQIKETGRVLSAPSFRKRARATRSRTNWLFRAAGVALGIGWMAGGGDLSTSLELAGFGVLIADSMLPSKWKEKAVLTSVKQQFTPTVAHMWAIAEHYKKAERDRE